MERDMAILAFTMVLAYLLGFATAVMMRVEARWRAARKKETHVSNEANLPAG